MFSWSTSAVHWGELFLIGNSRNNGRSNSHLTRKPASLEVEDTLVQQILSEQACLGDDVPLTLLSKKRTTEANAETQTPSNSRLPHPHAVFG